MAAGATTGGVAATSGLASVTIGAGSLDRAADVEAAMVTGSAGEDAAAVSAGFSAGVTGAASAVGSCLVASAGCGAVAAPPAGSTAGDSWEFAVGKERNGALGETGLRLANCAVRRSAACWVWLYPAAYTASTAAELMTTSGFAPFLSDERSEEHTS